jgi:hypothetical protein
MIKITTGKAGIFGPYEKVEELRDRLRCDGADLPFSVVGSYELAEWEGSIPKPPLAVPTAVAMWAGRRALIGAGIDLAHIDEHINAIADDKSRALAKSDWEFQTQIYRGSSLVSKVAAGLKLSDADVDGLFIRASEIEAMVNVL